MSCWVQTFTLRIQLSFDSVCSHLPWNMSRWLNAIICDTNIASSHHRHNTTLDCIRLHATPTTAVRLHTTRDSHACNATAQDSHDYNTTCRVGCKYLHHVCMYNTTQDCTTRTTAIRLHTTALLAIQHVMLGANICVPWCTYNTTQDCILLAIRHIALGAHIRIT
jgi:hypothetical protein